ncbi:MAG: hypothetical protein ACXACX_16515 [Candidatus Hodarchaeales archaeon]
MAFSFAIQPVIACSFAGPVSFSGHIDFYGTNTLQKVYERQFSSVSIGGTCELGDFNLKLNESYYIFATSKEEYTIFDLREEIPTETSIQPINPSKETNSPYYDSDFFQKTDNGTIYPAQRLLYTDSELVYEKHDIPLKKIVDIENSSIVDSESNRDNNSDIIIYELKARSTSDYFVAFSKFSDVNFTYEKYSLYYYEFETKFERVITFSDQLIDPYDYNTKIIVSSDNKYIGIYSSYVNSNSEEPIGLIYNMETSKLSYVPKMSFDEFRILNIDEAKNEVVIYHSNDQEMDEGHKFTNYIATLNLSDLTQTMTNETFNKIDHKFISSQNFYINAYYKTHTQIDFPLDILLVTLISLPFIRIILTKLKKKNNH